MGVMYARRDVLKGMTTASLAGLPLAAVLADPRLAKAAAGTLQDVSLTTAGGRSVSASLAMPAKTPAPTLVLIHEWWGLNDQIKAVAAEYANLGYVALAVDLMDGQVATTPDAARAQTGAVKPEEATDTLVSWAEWLKKHEASTGKLGTVGWCFGGGWSLNASIATPVDATVIYYGRVTREAADLKKLKGPVLGHFGTLDKFINQEMVSGFEAELKKAGKSDVTIHWYDADHAFANPSSARYDDADAKLSWDRTAKFFNENLT